MKIRQPVLFKPRLLLASSVCLMAMSPLNSQASPGYPDATYIAPQTHVQVGDKHMNGCNAATFKVPRLVGDGKKSVGSCFYRFDRAAVGSYLTMESDDSNAQAVATCVGPYNGDHGGWNLQHAWCYSPEDTTHAAKGSMDVILDSRKVQAKPAE